MAEGKAGKHLLVAGLLLLVIASVLNSAYAQGEEKQGGETPDGQGGELPPGIARGEGGDPVQTGEETTGDQSANMNTTEENCFDSPENADLCKTWVAIGECEANADWMRSNCFRSCGYCRFANLTMTTRSVQNEGLSSTASSLNTDADIVTPSTTPAKSQDVKEGGESGVKDGVSPTESSSTPNATIAAETPTKDAQVTEPTNSPTPTKSTVASTTVSAITTTSATPTPKPSTTTASPTILAEGRTTSTQAEMANTTTSSTSSDITPSPTTKQQKDETAPTSSTVSSTASTKLSPTPADTTLDKANPSSTSAPSTTLSTASTVSTPSAPTRESTTVSSSTSAPSTSPTSPPRASTPPAPPQESTTMKDISSSTLPPSTPSTSSTIKESTTPGMTQSSTRSEPTSPGTPTSSTPGTTMESTTQKYLSSTTAIPTSRSTTAKEILPSTTSSGTVSTASTSQAAIKETSPGKEMSSSTTTVQRTTPSSTTIDSTTPTSTSTTANPSTTPTTASTTMAATTTAAAATTTMVAATKATPATVPALQTESTTQRVVPSSTLAPSTAPTRTESTTKKDISSSTVASSMPTSSASTASTTVASIKETTPGKEATTPSATPGTSSTVSSTLPVVTKETNLQSETPSTSTSSTAGTTPSTSRATVSTTEPITKSSTTEMSSSTSSIVPTSPSSTTMKLSTTISTEMPTTNVSTTIKTAAPSTEGSTTTVTVPQPTTTTVSSSLEPTSPSTTPLPSSSSTMAPVTSSTTMKSETTKSTMETTSKSTTLPTGTPSTLSTTMQSTVKDSTIIAESKSTETKPTTTQQTTESTVSSAIPTTGPILTTVKMATPTTEVLSSSTVRSTVSAITVSTKAATTTGKETPSGIGQEGSTSSSITKLAPASASATQSTSPSTPSTSQVTAEPTSSTITTRTSTSQEPTSSVTTPTDRPRPVSSTVASSSRGTTESRSTSGMATKEPVTATIPDISSKTITATTPLSTAMKTMKTTTTVRLPTTTSRPCVNAHDEGNDCDGWSLDGECTAENQEWMTTNCYKSCGYCDSTELTTVLTTVTPACADNPTYTASCDGWRAIGECERNVDWMRTFCALSCGACEAATEGMVSVTPSTAASTTSTTGTTPSPTTTTMGPTPMLSTSDTLVNISTDLLISNETHILYYDGESVKVIVSKEKGNIVGLAVDVAKGLIFWSDLAWNTKGIYRATLDGQNQTRIISEDIAEVNGLTVDYASGHIYWTDAVRRRIEMADYDGRNRHMVISRGLGAPRGIVADPLHGYLFWGDQGMKTISRSLLDGSDRVTIVDRELIWPNQLALLDNELLYVDGWDKTLTSIDLDGGNRKQVAVLSTLANDNPLFGLAVANKTAYVTSWGNGGLIKVPLVSEGIVTPSVIMEGLSRDVMFSVASTDPSGQPSGLNPCSWPDKGGCSHLCLPTGLFTYRCSCPSIGGRVPRGKMCVVPDAVLLYADADLGQVTFTDPSATVPEEYVIGTSRRPVAVGYDPVDQVVYWSDVQERSIHKAFLNGTGHSVLLNASHGLGFVDGLFVDWQHRKLYFTNADFVTLDGTAFTWHKIEVVGLDGEGRRSVITDVEQPRGLWVDMEAGYLYYTDWGTSARLVRSQLDGFQQEVLRDGLENPNDVIVTGDAIYVIDSHAKGRDAGREGAKGALYRLSRGSQNWTRVENVTLQTPFGLTNSGNKFYISDWGLGAILSYDVTTGQTATIINDLNEPMGVFYTAVKVTAPPAENSCSMANCPDVCLTSATGSAQCACSSNDAKVQASFGGCVEPENFVLIADLNEIRLVSQRPVDSHVYTVISGNRYAASFSALLWDSQRNKFYFSDVNRRVLYQGDLSGRYSVLYDARDIIDGLALGGSGSDLYWTAQEEGAIYRLDLDNPGSNATAIAHGLSQPKALIHSPDTSELYWTEVGNMGAVRRMSEMGGDIVTMWESAETRPLNLFLDTGRRWVGFAVRGSGAIYTCLITGGSCVESSSLPSGAGIVPSIAPSGDYLYYSNWTSGSIQRSPWADNVTVTVTVIDGLMRPTDFAVVTRTFTNDMCRRNHMCSDICVALPLDYACACSAGRLLLVDGRQCYDTVQSSSTVGTTRFASSTTTSTVPTLSDIQTTTTETTRTTASSTQTQTSTKADRTSTSPTMSSTERSSMTDRSTTTKVLSSTEGPSTSIPSTERSTVSSTAGVVSTRVVTNATRTVEPTSESTTSSIGDTRTPSVMSSTPTSARSTTMARSSSTASTMITMSGTLPSSTVSSTSSTQMPTTSTAATPSTSQTVSRTEPTSSPTITPTASTTAKPTTIKTIISTETVTTPTTSRSTAPSTSTETVTTPTTSRSTAPSTPTETTVMPTSTMSSRMTATPSIKTTETTLVKPTFNFCPRNRTALIERGGESVEVWWLEPEAVDRNGNILSDIKVNREPGELFKMGLTFVTYRATDSEGRESTCTFSITVERQEFSCSGLPAPLNGDMVCRTEEFVYTCEVQCRPGYVPNTDITSIRPACRTTGWGPAFPPDYISLSCLKQKQIQQTLPVTITYNGGCRGGLTDDFKQAFTTKVVWNIRNAGLCPPVPSDQDLGLCDPTGFQLRCDTGVSLRKRRQVERIRLNVTLSGPASDPTGMNEQRMSETRDNLELLLLSDRLDVELDGQSYIAQQVAPLQQARIGCPPGYVIKDKTCMLCPAGSFVPAAGRECVSCPAGSYQPRPASYTCLQCPAGTSAPKGAFSASLCVSETPPTASPAASTSGNSLSVPIVIGLCVAAGIVFIITLTVAVCTVRRLFKSKGQMKLDQEKAMLNGSNGVRYTNPAFVARPQEETSGKSDSTPRYVAITKTGAGNEIVPAGPGMPQQPVQYRRLPNGQVVRVVAVAAPGANGTNSKMRMPPVKSRKYEMKHPAPVRSTPAAAATIVRSEENAPAQGMYRKYQPSSGWQAMSEADKLNQ